MPFIRLYSRDVPLDEKRLLAQNLISITLRTFDLRPEERDQITIQFLPRASQNSTGKRSAKPSEVTLEISDHDLRVEKITAFVREATPLLKQSKAVRGQSPIARWLGIRPDESRQVAFQFNEMESSSRSRIDEPFADVPQRKAA
jgi:hypothetical protein